MSDLTVEYDGSVARITPNTEQGKSWLEVYTRGDPFEWEKGTYSVEVVYGAMVAGDAIQEGLSVDRPARPSPIAFRWVQTFGPFTDYDAVIDSQEYRLTVGNGSVVLVKIDRTTERS